MVKKTETIATPELEEKPAPVAEKAPEVDIDALLESKVAQAINKILSDSHLADIVPMMQAKIDATDKKLADLTQLLTSLAEKAQAAAGQAALAQGGGGNGMGDLSTLVALLRGGGGGGGTNFTEVLTQMKGVLEMANTMFQAPRLAGAREVIDIMKAGSQIGMSTDQVIKGADVVYGKSNEPKSA